MWHVVYCIYKNCKLKVTSQFTNKYRHTVPKRELLLFAGKCCTSFPINVDSCMLQIPKSLKLAASMNVNVILHNTNSTFSALGSYTYYVYTCVLLHECVMWFCML